MQTFYAARLKGIEQATFKQCVCLFAALPVNGIVAVSEPVKKLTRPVIRIMLGKKNNAIAIQYIGYTLFAIRGLEFEPVSGTHELNALLFGKTGADWDSAPEQTGTLLMLQS